MSLTFPEYESFDGLGLANLIKRNVLSPDEVLDAAIERIELWNPKLNAVIHKMYDQARAASKNLPEGTFKGVPILLKDLLAECEGTPMRMGSRFTHGWVSQRDSEIIKRLKKTGVLILGKTNVPEFGLSPVTEPEVFGPTYNPWDTTRSPGGSSGGSAAAVAARMVPIAHGGDGAGSIRIPAAYSGIFGFKPSRGRTPTGPIYMRVWQGMVTEHVLTRSVRDSAAMLDELAGPELGSLISLPKPTISFLDSLEKPVSRLRIAVLEKPFFAGVVDPEYIAATKKAAELCTSLGHEVEYVTLNIESTEVALAFFIMMMAETAAGIKMLGKALGRHPKRGELEKKTRVVYYTGNNFSAADYATAIQLLDSTERKLAEFFENFDIILTPTMGMPPPKIGQHKLAFLEQGFLEVFSLLPHGSLLRNLAQRISTRNFAFAPFTPLFNIGGQPAMSVPLYWDSNNLPIGIQFAAKLGHDVTLLQLARQLEEAQPWANRKPL